MCGVYGHERAHADDSRGIYELSWKPRLTLADSRNENIVVAGFSCRHQVGRFGNRRPRSSGICAATRAPPSLSQFDVGPCRAKDSETLEITKQLGSVQGRFRARSIDLSNPLGSDDQRRKIYSDDFTPG